MRIDPHTSFIKSFDIKGIKISYIDVLADKGEVILNAEVLSLKGVAELKIIEKALKEKVGDKFLFKCLLTFPNEDILLAVISKSVAKLKIKNIAAKVYLNKFKASFDGHILSIAVKDEISIEKLEGTEAILEKELLQDTFMEWSVKYVEGDLGVDFQQKLDEQLDQKAKEQDIEREEHHRYVLGKKIAKKPISIEAFYSLEFGDEVVLEGEVFNLRVIRTSGDRFILLFNLNDGTSSVSVKAFIKEEKIKIGDGSHVRLKGKKTMDDFDPNEALVSLSDLTEISTPKTLEDNAPKKRIELHAHTKMSEMDSIVGVERLIDKAAAYGHSGVAITDGGVVYAFPNAYSYASKYENFKIILGMEGYVVNDLAPKVYGHYMPNKSLEEQDFVVFDIETTGLDPYKDKIIELAAVRVKKGRIENSYSSLINPEIPIPQITTEITGIKDSMLEDAPKIEEVLDKFLEFCKGSILIAHNASFDMGFMRQKSLKLKREFNFGHIDTLQWCRSLLPNSRKHGLKEIGKLFGMDFRHHRALDDTNVTAHIFLKLMEILKGKGAESLGDIDKVMEINQFHTFPDNVLIYVKDNIGLRNLYEMVSLSHLTKMKKIPKITKSLIKEKREGLLLGTSLVRGEIIPQYLSGVPLGDLKKELQFYDFMEVFPPSTTLALLDRRFNYSIKDVENLIKVVIDFCDECGVPVLATGNVKYLDENEAGYRKVLKIDGSRKNMDEKMFFRTTEQMLDEFAFLGKEKSEEIVISNTISIAKLLEKVSPIPNGFFPPRMEGSDDMVRKMSYDKAHRIYGNNLPDLVKKRMERELKAIIGNGFSVLYLLSHKLVNKSLEDGYLVGSRGSVGSSFVAWLMDITEVNALYPHYLCLECKHSEFIEHEGSGVDLPPKDCPNCGTDLFRDGHSIPFEVFMGFKGEKVPDIDLNFSGEYQPKVHSYVEELFGSQNVFRAGTISTLAKKNAFGYAKKYVEDNGLQLPKAHMEYLALKCEGARKTTGQHPGGVIILPEDREIYDFTPIQKPANDMAARSRTTHFDYHVMDKQLVKMDILGHDDPTTLKILEDYSGIKATDIPLNDPKTISIFSSTKSLGLKERALNSSVGTFGIPEFGTPFSRRMLSDTRPTTFAELVRISGLSHGISVWTGNAQKLIKSGAAKLSDVISVRDDIMNYLIDQGVEKHEAFDIMEFIRKGLPSKDPKKWKHYIGVMEKHKVPTWYIESCEKITYMFPKGHAVAYVLMAVRIAYFKVHRPVDFYAAYLTRKVDFFDFEVVNSNDIDILKKSIASLNAQSRLDAKGKNDLYVLEVVLEMFLRKVEILPIDLYKSDINKFIPEDGKVRVPLVAMKGLGSSVAENIVRERSTTFISVEDLKKRTKIPKTVCDSMKNLGLVDLQELNQKTLF